MFCFVFLKKKKKDLKNIEQVPLFFPFVLVVLVSYWKMAVQAKRKLNHVAFFKYLKNLKIIKKNVEPAQK